MDTITSPSIRAELLRISNQRATIAVQRAALEKQDCQLAYLWNTYQHPNRLPAEVLVDVFTASALRGYIPTSSWMSLRLVCRRWNEVACGTPSLWRTVDVYRNQNWLALCLARSAQATLDIIFHPASSQFPIEGFQTSLFLHAARIRSLTVLHRVPQKTLSNLLPLFAFNMPALENVTFVSPLPRAAELHFSHHRQPYLRRLYLNRLCCPVDLQVLSNLRSLTLTTCREAFRVDHFLDTLASSSRLESLRLDYFLHGLIGELHPPSTSLTKPIALPQLDGLRVTEGDMDIISTFTSYLRLPPSASIYLSCYPEITQTTGPLSNFLPSPAHRTSFMPLLGCSTVTDASLWLFSAKYAMRALDTTHGSTLFLSIHESAGEVLENDSMGLQHGVSDLLDLLDSGAAPLTRLSIAGLENNAPVGAWNQLFTSFPALEFLTLSPAGSRTRMATFWAALCGSDADTGDSTTAIPWPCLSYLELADGFTMSPALFSQMLDCLEWRKARGSRLRYLQLQLDDRMHRDEGQLANILTDDLDIPRLRSLVDELAM